MTVSSAEQRNPECATADPQPLRARALELAVGCWRQRVWWLPIIGPFVAAWIAAGDPYSLLFPMSDMTTVLLPPSLMVVWRAFPWALWIVAAAELHMPAVSPVLLPGVVLARFVTFAVALCLIIFGWIYVVLRFTATLEVTDRFLGMNVDGGFLALAWMAAVGAGVCAGVASAFRRPGCSVARMLTETASHPPSPDEMLRIAGVLNHASVTLLSLVVGLLVSAFDVSAAGNFVIGAVVFSQVVCSGVRLVG